MLRRGSASAAWRCVRTCAWRSNVPPARCRGTGRIDAASSSGRAPQAGPGRPWRCTGSRSRSDPPAPASVVAPGRPSRAHPGPVPCAGDRPAPSRRRGASARRGARRGTASLRPWRDRCCPRSTNERGRGRRSRAPRDSARGVRRVGDRGADPTAAVATGQPSTSQQTRNASARSADARRLQRGMGPRRTVSAPAPRVRRRDLNCQFLVGPGARPAARGAA